MISLAKTISHIAKSRLGRHSLIYRIGALAFRRARPLLVQMGIPPRQLYDDSELLRRIARESTHVAGATEGKNIAFFTIRGWSLHIYLETLLAARLQGDGHHVRFISCNDSLSLCAYGSINVPEPKRRDCAKCLERKDATFSKHFETIFLPAIHSLPNNYVNLVDALDLQECMNFEYDGAPYGQLVGPGLIWYLRRSRLTEVDAPVFRAALKSAHSVRIGLDKIVSSIKIDTVVMLNGDFVAEKVASFVLESRRIRFITHDYTIGHMLAVAENRSVWNDLTFSPDGPKATPDVTSEDLAHAEELLALWRRKGGYQGQLFWSTKDLDRPSDLRRELGLPQAPLAVAYTNLTFESSVIGKDRVFINQFDWLRALVVFFSQRPEFCLVVRIHPAEVRDSHWRPNESLYAFLMEEVGLVPPNVHVIGPHEPVSSYALATMAQLALVYSSTLGLELAERGMGVVTAADVHYGGRGFTLDPATSDDYFKAVTELLSGNSVVPCADRRKVVSYVAWLFRHRLLRTECLTLSEDAAPRLAVNSLADLRSPSQIGLQRLVNLVVEGDRWW